jgi:hypothetical protein
MTAPVLVAAIVAVASETAVVAAAALRGRTLTAPARTRPAGP